MRIAVLLTSFGVIAVGELPDKTFIAGLIMATRSRPMAVWAGSATALVAQAGLAVGAGRLVAFLPRRATDVVVALAFLGGAIYLLAVGEKSEEAKGARLAAGSSRWHRVALTAAAVVFVAEWGDVTQIAMVGLTARSRAPLSVFFGSALALVAVSGLAALAGKTLARRVPLQLVRRIGGVVLAALAAVAVAAAAGG